ncbi:glycosyltransferase family 4 protein [Enterobacter sp. CC120223-11]|uniref:glycosyltransferase family 4 protein n=1 Tax=Enterobacter sp. CC120223-11 TaxID=1378073 RepID=UPI000BD1509A|nr:glycosyltransferase family 4 protein [Enterobacter sp. CC120223-11]SNY64166.1 Glycosyltransferase involved in cell wall bisynthesis [Enterobacter sp. CC120223-11]
MKLKNKPYYDFVFITNVPAFYKVNLFNELSKTVKLKVIFISNKSEIRNSDFYSYDINFDYITINHSSYETRNKAKTFFRLFQETIFLNYKYLVFSGWETKEASLLSFLTPKLKNAIVIESSILETNVDSIKFWIKKVLLSRISVAFPSGFLQRKILTEAGFNGEIHITHGVGISNYQSQFEVDKYKRDEMVFLYVGRISQEKNIAFLVNTFKDINAKLLIVGDGDLRKNIESSASENVYFLGYVENKKLKEIYSNSDCFILPSLSEPWGLVIEEALTFGLPVIVSDMVGCHFDLVTDKNGIVYEVNSYDALKNAIQNISFNIEKYKQGAKLYQPEKIAELQIESYCGALNVKE